MDYGRILPLIGWLGMLASLGGCAHTAELNAWRPAEVDVTGISRLTVMEFTGPEGKAVSSALAAKLWQSEFFTLIDRTQVQASFQRDIPVGNTALALQAANAAGVQGVILGEVVAYKCDDHVTEDQHFHVATSSNESEKDSKGKKAGKTTEIGIDRNVTFKREATVALTFRLIDVRTGQVRATKPVTHSFSDQSVNGDKELPPAHEVLAQLLNECTTDIAVMLAPHQAAQSVELVSSNWFSKGGSLVNDGIKLAQNNQWDRAAAAWQAALKVDPKNHAALYNLALAHEAKHDYVPAEDFVSQAIAVRPNNRYSDALERIRQEKTNYLLAQQQRDSRNVNTAIQWTDSPATSAPVTHAQLISP